MTAIELIINLWYRLPRPVRAAYHRIGFGPRRMLRKLITDEIRTVRIEGGILRGMYMRIRPRTEHRVVLGDAELDVQVSLPRLISPGMCVYNVGANLGLFTLALSRLVGPSGSVVAFEPNPPVADRLRENIALNALANVTVAVEAVSDTTGVVPFALLGDFKSCIAVVPGTTVNAELIGVPSTTIDAYVEAGAHRPDAVMMDVEGGEGMVLRGARVTLRNCRPLLVIEVHTAATGLEVLGELEAVDYSLAELPTFRQVRTPGEIRPRGHYVAAHSSDLGRRTPARTTPN